MTTVENLSAARHEYRMKGWYRSLFLILGAPSIAGGIIMSSLAFKGAFAPLPVFMTLAFFFFGVYLLALATRSRVIIEGTRIEIRGASLTASPTSTKSTATAPSALATAGTRSST